MQDEGHSYEYKFSMRHHWWFDSGLAGLFYIAADVIIRNEKKYSISQVVDVDGIQFKCQSQEELKEFLDECYAELVSRYWNVSNKAQKEAKELVRLNTNTGEIELIPRRNPTPIPALFTGARSWRADGILYNELSLDMKSKVDNFLSENKRSLWGSKRLLVYDAPVCHQKIELFPNKKKTTICSICGKESVCSEVSQPSFLLFASSSATLSFNSEGRRPDKLCWECELLSKFAVELAHYKSSDENLYVLQLTTSNMKKLIDSQVVLGGQSVIRQFDKDNFYSNIGIRKEANQLLYYARLPYELLWAFFHDTYSILRADAENCVSSENDLFMICLKPFIETPLKMTLLMLSSKGQTFMLKEIIAYTEIAYIFRIMHWFNEQNSDCKFLYQVFQDMYVPIPGKPFDVTCNLRRNQILRRVLQKKTILYEIEQLVFRKSIQQSFPYIGDLLVFTQQYQVIIQEGQGMTKEQIEIAVNLGKQIVVSAKALAEKTLSGNYDGVKGDLFSLRKTRKPTAFLEQLNRIQFRYSMSVSNHILDGILEEPGVEFAAFKSYCLLGALNTYNNLKRSKVVKPTEVN